MAVKIKLKRMGKIHAPYYRIVVADARTKRDGRAIEEIGKYHPKSEPSYIEVSSERAQYWLSVGAQPTDPVRRILEITGDWQRFRGEPGAEGTLRVAEPKRAKSDRFAEAAGQTKTAEAAPRGKARKPDTETKPDAKPDKADGSAKRKPRAAKSDAPDKAEAKPGKAAGKRAGAEAVTEAPQAEAPAPKAAAPDAEAAAPDAEAAAPDAEAAAPDAEAAAPDAEAAAPDAEAAAPEAKTVAAEAEPAAPEPAAPEAAAPEAAAPEAATTAEAAESGSGG